MLLFSVDILRKDFAFNHVLRSYVNIFVIKRMGHVLYYTTDAAVIDKNMNMWQMSEFVQFI